MFDMNSGAGVLGSDAYRTRPIYATRYPATPGEATIAPPSPDLTPQYQQALLMLRSYTQLEANWDYEEGRPLTAEAQAAGILLLNAFASANIVPQFSPTNDGGVLFEIENSTYLSLDVAADGNVHVFAVYGGKEIESSGSAANIVGSLFGHPTGNAGVTR